jgi:hypothetical protein
VSRLSHFADCPGAIRNRPDAEINRVYGVNPPPEQAGGATCSGATALTPLTVLEPALGTTCIGALVACPAAPLHRELKSLANGARLLQLVITNL